MDMKTITITAELTDAEALALAQPGTMETEREPSADERAGMDWWNLLPESGRAAWLAKAQSAKPSDAWATYKRTKNAPEGYGQPSPEF